MTGHRGADAAAVELDELTFLLESGPDRIGALDFQASASVYRPRERAPATLDELLEAAMRLERGDPLSPELALALQHGTSVGGARPKVLLGGADAKTIAKLSTSSDLFNCLCGNTDDHARNHAAFWDGRAFQLTPAYDICPQSRTGHEASQAQRIFAQSLERRCNQYRSPAATPPYQRATLG